MEGVVKWFDPEKRYGFISPVNGGKDVFVHISALVASEVPKMGQGQLVDFEITNDGGREVASNIRIFSENDRPTRPVSE